MCLVRHLGSRSMNGIAIMSHWEGHPSRAGGNFHHSLTKRMNFWPRIKRAWFLRKWPTWSENDLANIILLFSGLSIGRYRGSFPLGVHAWSWTVTHLSSHQGRHWPCFYSNVKRTCQYLIHYWLANFSASGETRNGFPKYHMVREIKTDWRTANYPWR